MAEQTVAARSDEVIRRLGEMAETNEQITAETDLGGILQRLAVRAREVTAADHAAISTFAEDGQMNRFVYAGISEELARRLGNPPIGRGLLGELVRHDRPLRTDNLKEQATFTGWPKGHPDMVAFLGVPIRAAGRTIGSLYMTRGPGRPPFSDTDELAGAILALQAAVSLAAALAHERTSRLSVLEERERIAHDLHDGTIQMLYALGLECDAYANREDFPEEVREAFASRVQRLNEMIQDIRSYITMLEAAHPAHSPELSRDLAFVVRQLVPPGVNTVVNVTAAALQELGGREAEDMLYIAREAVSNAVRHSGASKIAVDLRQNDRETTLTIQDNGVGFDQANVRTGLGTITMRTRAQRLGADLTILAIPGMGVTVHVALPRRQPGD